MTVEKQDTEFRHPETVAFLQILTDEEAAKPPLLIFEHDSVVSQH